MALIINRGNASFKGDVENLFETLQAQRADWLVLTRETMLAARLLALAEARRLETGEGGKDDPRAARLRAAGDAMARRSAALVVEQQIATIRTPPVTKTETLLQGRVTDESAKAAGRVTVTLIDEKGTPVAGVEPVEADDAGYYAFVLQPQQVEAIGATRQLTLLVGTQGGKLVPAAATPFTLASGKIRVGETRLQTAELEKLQLRVAAKSVVRVGKTVAAPVAPVARAAPAKAAETKTAAAKPAAKKPAAKKVAAKKAAPKPKR
jgi:hypothetical protein